eukprot:15444885-Alexandrium_andersonii.AAC.1
MLRGPDVRANASCVIVVLCARWHAAVLGYVLAPASHAWLGFLVMHVVLIVAALVICMSVLRIPR